MGEAEEADPIPEPKCYRRLDQLALPRKQKFLGLYQDHAYHLPPEKVIKLKQLLQELYAMTPEETAKYFAQVRTQMEAKALRQKIQRRMLQHLVAERNKERRYKAYDLFKRCLMSAIYWTTVHPLPDFVSIRVRYMSDLILEQLSDLRNHCVPRRDGKPDKLGCFLIQLADWMAIMVERLHFVVKLKMQGKTDDEPIPEIVEEPEREDSKCLMPKKSAPLDPIIKKQTLKKNC